MHRVITAVYYISNYDYVPTFGGCLRMHETKSDAGGKLKGHSESRKMFHDIKPIPGRLVLFRSDLVEHEVMPCFQKPRIAVTVWLYGNVVVPSNYLLDRMCVFSDSVPMQNIAALKNEPIDENNEDTGDHSKPLITPNSVHSSFENNATIFVSIASYRDSELSPTILDLMNKATNRERVFVGVVLQAHPKIKSENLFGLPQEWYTTNVRVLAVNYKHATGPCWARALAQSLMREEQYILQIDSHMRFRANWDNYLLHQHNKCADKERAILTTYPMGYSLPNNISSDTAATVLVPKGFDKNGLLLQKSRILKKSWLSTENIQSTLWAAGFNFASAKSVQDVPYNMNLHELFFGEEILMMTRFHSYGYKFYAPPEAVCFHLWTREHRPTFQEMKCDESHLSKKKEAKTIAQEYVKRQLREYNLTCPQKSCVKGVDFVKRTISDEARNAFLAPEAFEKTEVVEGKDDFAVAIIETLIGRHTES